MKDIVDFVLDQHEQLRHLSTEVQEATGTNKRRLFRDFDRLRYAHDVGEQRVVHPVLRDGIRGDDDIAVAFLAEGATARVEMAALRQIGVDHPTFDARFAAYRTAFLDHADHQERDELPRLRRYVTVERLHRMAYDIRDIQAMA